MPPCRNMAVTMRHHWPACTAEAELAPPAEQLVGRRLHHAHARDHIDHPHRSAQQHHERHGPDARSQGHELFVERRMGLGFLLMLLGRLHRPSTAVPVKVPVRRRNHFRVKLCIQARQRDPLLVAGRSKPRFLRRLARRRQHADDDLYIALHCLGPHIRHLMPRHVEQARVPAANAVRPETDHHIVAPQRLADPPGKPPKQHAQEAKRHRSATAQCHGTGNGAGRERPEKADEDPKAAAP